MLPLYSTGGLPRGSGSVAQADSIRLRLGIPIADVFIFKWTRKSKSPPWPQRTRQEWGTRFTGDWLLSAARSLWDRQESQSQSQRRRTGVSALHVQRKRKRPSRFLSTAFINAGNDLLSHTLSRAVQSALRGLTSVFGMGTGGTPAVRSPTSRSS